MCITLLTFVGSAFAGRSMPSLVTPEGQMLVIIGEAEDRSDAFRRGDEMGFTSRAKFSALREVENQRSAGNYMLEAGLNLSGSNEMLVWPAGQWLEFSLTGGEVLRATRIFASGPKTDMDVYPLGQRLVRVPRDRLHSNTRRGVNFIPTLFYVAIPSSVQRHGRSYGISMSDIASVRLIHVSPDSLTAALQRR